VQWKTRKRRGNQNQQRQNKILSQLLEDLGRKTTEPIILETSDFFFSFLFFILFKIPTPYYYTLL